MEHAHTLKVTITGAVAAMTALWGWFGWLLLLWLGCMILDYVTGSAAAASKGEWSSQAARSGIWHKLGCVVAVTASAAADLLIKTALENLPAVHMPFEYGVLLCPLVLVWYTLTELGSIIENAMALGAPVPKFLVKAIAVGKSAVEGSEDAEEKG